VDLDSNPSVRPPAQRVARGAQRLAIPPSPAAPPAGGHDGEALAPKGQGTERRSDKPRSGLHWEAARRVRPKGPNESPSLRP